MKVGDEILHPELGKGTVVALLSRGGRPGAFMDFDYMTDWVSAEELGRANASEALEPTVDPAKSRVPKLPDSVVEARRGVLALKLGQILECHVRQLSTGTGEIEASMEKVVSRALGGKPGFILVHGAWGGGKTHLLTMLNAIAADRGMASSGAILDGAGLRLSDPMKLVAALLAALRYPNERSPRGIRDKFAAFRKMDMRSPRSASVIARAIRALAAARKSPLDDPDALETIEDYFSLALSASGANARLTQFGYRGVHLPSMIARRVHERPDRFCRHLEEWTEFVTKTGATGLLLTFDELDVEYSSTMGYSAIRREERRRRTALLSALAQRERFSAGGRRLPLVIAFGSAPGSTDIAEEDDPVRDLQSRLGTAGLTIIEAPRPDLRQTCDLGRRILALYERAYPGWSERVDRRRVEERLENLAETHLDDLAPVPRNFVRRTLELLDVAPKSADLRPSV